MHVSKLFGLAGCVLAAGVLPAAAEPDAGVTIAGCTVPRATLLAIDDVSFPLKRDLCYYLSRPKIRAEPVLRPNRSNPHATDGVGVFFYGTVLHDGGRFRMWYYSEGWRREMRPDASNQDWLNNENDGPICYAESEDGLHWTRPSLGQVDWKGGSDNNAIAFPETNTEGAFVIKDEGDPDPGRRYKMVFEALEGDRPRVQMATSVDGIVWSFRGTAAVGLEPSSFYKFNGLYCIGAQKLGLISEGGHRAGRQGFVWVSPDFDHWPAESGESFILPEPADPNGRGGDRPYVQVHLGVGAVSYGNVLVGLYCQWHARPNPFGDWFGYGTTFGNFGLLVSNDGQHFREPVKGYVFLNRADSPVGDRVSPDIRREEILTQAGNGILNVRDETWIYHGRWANPVWDKDSYSEIALATLPRDRWGALGLYPQAEEGSVWTAPMVIGKAGGNISLNAQGVAGIGVEIADERFGLIAEYSGENAGAVAAADGLDCPVAWPKGSLNPLIGRRVRLLIHLKKGEHAEPRLFAAYVSCK